MRFFQWVLDTIDRDATAAAVRKLREQAQRELGLQFGPGGADKQKDREAVIYVDYNPRIPVADAASVQLTRWLKHGVSVVQVAAEDDATVRGLFAIGNDLLDAVSVEDLAARAVDARGIKILGCGLGGTAFHPDAHDALAKALQQRALRAVVVDVACELGWRALVRPLAALAISADPASAVDGRRGLEVLDPPSPLRRVLAPGTSFKDAVARVEKALKKGRVDAAVVNKTKTARHWGHDDEIVAAVLDSEGTVRVEAGDSAKDVVEPAVRDVVVDMAGLKAAARARKPDALTRMACATEGYDVEVDELFRSGLVADDVNVRRDAARAVGVAPWPSALPDIFGRAASEDDDETVQWMEDAIAMITS